MAFGTQERLAQFKILNEGSPEFRAALARHGRWISRATASAEIVRLGFTDDEVAATEVLEDMIHDREITPRTSSLPIYLADLYGALGY